jgi:hypothetical protein
MGLSVDDVKKRVEEIRGFSGDDECAHGAEDSLWEEVLRAISEGECDDPKGCAAAALTTGDIPFSRWYA